MQKNIHCQTQLGVTQGEWVKRFSECFGRENLNKNITWMGPVIKAVNKVA